MGNLLLSVENVHWSSGETDILKGVDLDLNKGSTIVINGPAESGKSLLLKIIAGIEPPEMGSIKYNDLDLFKANEKDILEIRKKISVVFEDGVFLSNLVIQENMLLPFKYHYDDYNQDSLIHRINHYLEFFGLPDILQERPASVSRGYLKLLSFIRAVITDPELIIIDNPYFNLELINQKKVEIFLEEQKEKQTSMLIASGDKGLIKKLADDLIIIKDGSIVNRFSINSTEFSSWLEND
jgi:ABC-type multidrug transport system ATPase subunit